MPGKTPRAIALGGGWPHGHHTNPKLPLMYMGLSTQKNDMVVYMLFLHHNKP